MSETTDNRGNLIRQDAGCRRRNLLKAAPRMHPATSMCQIEYPRRKECFSACSSDNLLVIPGRKCNVMTYNNT
jgi:hypothetical protein